MLGIRKLTEVVVWTYQKSTSLTINLDGIREVIKLLIMRFLNHINQHLENILLLKISNENNELITIL